MRTLLKDDLGYTSAELVYGITLRLSDELLDSTPDSRFCSILDLDNSLGKWGGKYCSNAICLVTLLSSVF